MIQQDRVPSQFRAGETVSVLLDLGDYPAPTWSLSLILRKHGAEVLTLTATPSGTKHLISAAADVTADYTPGRWAWIVRVSAAGVVHDYDRGEVEVLGNFADESHDPRTEAETMRDAFWKLYQGRALDAHESYTLKDTSVEKSSREQLYAEYQRWARRVAQDNGWDTSKAQVVYE